MPKNLKQLVLRTRTQTLRSNLCQAYQTLESLPRLSLGLENIKDALDRNELLLREHAFVVRDVSLNPGVSDDVTDASHFMEKLIRAFGNWKGKLEEIESSSFLAQVKSSGVDDWRRDLQLRAGDLGRSIENVRTWRDLTTVETDAREKVFSRSVELLGGIALRDARLNADVCELADELLKAIRPAEEVKHYAILGGLSIMLMRLERIVRLPFPQWSIWDLPLAAHELWHVSRKSSAEMRERVIKRFGSGILPDSELDKCLADAFATYAVGPAFGYAAITLWFDPADLRYDLRVQAIRAMLRAMNRGWEGAGLSYDDVSNDLQAAWQSAAEQARPVPAEQQEPPEENGGFDALYAAFTEEVRGRGALQDAMASDDVRDALKSAYLRLAAEAKPAAAPPVDDAKFVDLCAAMTEDLEGLGYKRFPLRDWMAAKSWQDVRNKDNKSQDLRHVLNAAWLARIEATVDDDELTAELTARAKQFLKPQPASPDLRLPEGMPR